MGFGFNDIVGELKKGVSQVSAPFNKNWAGEVGKTVNGVGNKLGSAAKDVYGVGKGVVNEVWYTAKGALGSATGLLDNLGSAINNPLFLILIGGIILLIVLK